MQLSLAVVVHLFRQVNMHQEFKFDIEFMELSFPDDRFEVYTKDIIKRLIDSLGVPSYFYTGNNIKCVPHKVDWKNEGF